MPIDALRVERESLIAVPIDAVGREIRIAVPTEALGREMRTAVPIAAFLEVTRALAAADRVPEAATSEMPTLIATKPRRVPSDLSRRGGLIKPPRPAVA